MEIENSRSRSRSDATSQLPGQENVRKGSGSTQSRSLFGLGRSAIATRNRVRKNLSRVLPSRLLIRTHPYLVADRAAGPFIVFRAQSSQSLRPSVSAQRGVAPIRLPISILDSKSGPFFADNAPPTSIHSFISTTL